MNPCSTCKTTGKKKQAAAAAAALPLAFYYTNDARVSILSSCHNQGVNNGKY